MQHETLTPRDRETRKQNEKLNRHTVAGQAGNPLTLASTRSPTSHFRWAAAAAALLAAFLRLGAI